MALADIKNSIVNEWKETKPWERVAIGAAGAFLVAFCIAAYPMVDDFWHNVKVKRQMNALSHVFEKQVDDEWATQILANNSSGFTPEQAQRYEACRDHFEQEPGLTANRIMTNTGYCMLNGLPKS